MRKFKPNLDFNSKVWFHLDSMEGFRKNRRARQRAFGRRKKPRLSKHQREVRFFTGIGVLVVVIATIYFCWHSGRPAL
jgi:hypothetical protein